MKNKISTGEIFARGAVLLFLLPLFMVSCTSEPELPTSDEAKTAIWKKIEAANDKWASGDPMGFIDCSAQDIFWIDDLEATSGISGIETLKAYLATYKGVVPPHKHELTKLEFQIYGAIAITSYQYQGYFEDIDANPWKVTAVYRYADDDWLSVHENWSKVEPKEPKEQE